PPVGAGIHVAEVELALRPRGKSVAVAAEETAFDVRPLTGTCCVVVQAVAEPPTRSAATTTRAHALPFPRSSSVFHARLRSLQLCHRPRAHVLKQPHRLLLLISPFTVRRRIRLSTRYRSPATPSNALMS